MPAHEIGTREQHQAAREKLLEREKELTRRNDELARERLELPWVEIEKEYAFETEEGTKTLADLFDGRSQLLVYHFMFGPSYEAGCTACSSAADGFNGAVPHLNARDVTFLCDSRAPLDKLNAYKQRMGWSFPWVSSLETDFRFDLGFSQTDEQATELAKSELPPSVAQMAAASGTDSAGYLTEAPGLSAFALEDGAVYRTYSTMSRGLEPLMVFYPMLDRTPRGRHEEGETESWLRRHDEYEQTKEASR
jgi:predicted dithiol-disulfide oxidoreductase (DUF899 family)